MNLLTIAIAPILIIAFYVYVRDKYEKEPIWMLVKALIGGALAVIPILFVETYLVSQSNTNGPAYTAFIVAASTEEFFKYVVLLLLIWYNKNFNEKFDGIVYAVYVSLGFAAVENIMYVFNYGFSVGLIRAITAVPAHATFGVLMGYSLAIAKFFPDKRLPRLILTLVIPIIFHGIYDYLLMTKNVILTFAIFPFIIYMWIRAFKRMNTLSKASIFKPQS